MDSKKERERRAYANIASLVQIVIKKKKDRGVKQETEKREMKGN